MYANSTLQPIEDNAPYVSSTGVQYPGNFPKNEIAELHPVSLTQKPTESQYLTITGFHIDETYTQVWDTISYTQGEVDAVNAAARSANYVSEAADALQHSDITVLRCIEANVAVPAEWTAYRNTLRNIVSGRDIIQPPARPTYPVGT